MAEPLPPPRHSPEVPLTSREVRPKPAPPRRQVPTSIVVDTHPRPLLCGGCSVSLDRRQLDMG